MWNARRASTGSRSSRTSSHMSSHVSVGSHSVRGSHAREIEFQFFIRQTETLYPPWWTRQGIVSWYRDLPDDTLWNCYICGCVLTGIVWTVSQFQGIYLDIIDVVYNISYAIHVFAIGYKIITEMENTDITFWTVMAFLVDLGSFAHYVQGKSPTFKLICYYVRLHRPFRYLGSLNDYNLKGSILGITLKYIYIFVVLRITWAYVWMHMDMIGAHYYTRRIQQPMNSHVLTELQNVEESPGSKFLSATYIINKMFIPIGPSVYPINDIERIVCLMIMITGCLVVTGAAVASLSLVISLYMRPEESFRARYRLIMREMKETRVPPAVRNKVETFYKMYWHKQRAVSETQLLPIFPPTLPATINADIYFEATQKARILRELSYQMLSELVKKMETIHYIPGDAIIKRGAIKSNIIYITYGDVEMLTAEDDLTAILRLTRGTVLTPCGGAVAAALGMSHLAVRAATFCTAHVLRAAELWRIVHKHSVTQDHAGPILAAFTDHIERVKRHYTMKLPDPAYHKSSILRFNRNLMALKDMRDAKNQSLLSSSDVFLEIAGCYIMRNRPDSTLTDQSDEICLRPTFPCILQPTSSLLVAWHSFVAALILTVCISHPYYLVYKKSVPLWFRFFDYVVTGVFVLDHIVHLSTGANVEEGVPITFTQTSSQQMRSHWFVLDVVATLPIFEFVGDGHFAGINKILRLPKLFRVLKSMEETCVYHSNVLRFLTYTLLLLIACYLIASMQQLFMCYQSGYCLVTNFTHPPFWEAKPLDEETVKDRLAFGLYWAISMINFTIHRETWGKESWKEVLYTLVILEICIVLRIFMEAVYSATIMVTTALREDYGARISTVKNFLIRNDVDPPLMKRFITYLELCWYTDKAYQMTHKKHSNIFYDLPPHVFQDIVGRNRSKYILGIPFMRLITKEDLRVVSSNAKLFYTSPNEILLNTGELINEIYIIKQGICEILDPVTQKCRGYLTAKNHFGAVICLLRLPAYYTIRAVTHVQVFCIRRKFMLNALENPQIQQTVEFLKTQPEFNRLQTRIPAFITYVPPPPTPNMMHFRLPRKHEPDAEFLHPFNRLGFLSILRYIFPRFTIRPDGKYLLGYEWLRITSALLSAMLFPHYTYLVLQWPFLYYIALLLDLSAWFDIFQRMLVGYFNEKGILVYHPSSTAAYYMKGAFIVDLFGCLPLENLEGARKDSVGDRYRVTPTKQFLMLNRLLQLYRMPSAILVLKDYIERRDILMVIKAIPLFMAMLNGLTCFMVFYSANIYYTTKADGTYDWLIEPFPDRGGSWMHLFANAFRFNLTETPWNMHLATYFWVVYECSTTGYGKFNPSNHDLMEVLFIGMSISTMIITYFSVRIISIRANVNKSLAGFQQHMKDINVYMIREKLDGELQKEVRRYYEYNWEKMGGIDYRGVLKLCDQITLRTDAILHIYGPTFAKCPLLTNSDVSLLRIIGRAVHSVYFLRDMKIIETDDMVTDVYFVDYGGVEIRVPTGDMFSVLRLPRGSVFGNLEGTAGHRSPYEVVATSRVHLLMINAKAFSSIASDFPGVKELMEQYRTSDKKMYILGSEVKVRMRRNITASSPRRSQKSFVKYVYFQEGMIQFYLIFICMGCIYLDLYNVGYQDNSMWLIVTLYVLDFGFLLKILTQHLIPLLVINQNIKKLMLPIRRMYFKQEFKYDLISVLPIELLSFAAPGVLNDWMWFSWLRLNRTFRIATVHKCLKLRNEKITVNLTVTTVMAVFIWFTLFVHTTTCIWYYIGMIEDAFMPNSSWMYSDDRVSQCENHYICSLYFVITTFTQNGVGDIMPKMQSEVVFVSLLQILSTMVFMVYVGEFSNIIQFQSYRSFSFYSKYLELQEFMNNNRVSKNLMTIVNKYTLHLWRENRGLQVPHFLKNAPLSLRLRVMSCAYLHHITRHHIFEECEPAFLRQLVGCLQLFTYNAGMFVVKESEITDSMYVIHTGKVKETCEDMDISARVYPAGSYFGIMQGLLRSTPYTHSYQTMIKSQVLTLHLNDWEYLLKHFPDSRDAIHKHMRQIGDKDMDQSNWPGGPPGAPPVPVLERLPTYQPEDFPVGLYPEGRRSTVADEAPSTPLTDFQRRPSQRFEWPIDSRGSISGSPGAPSVPSSENKGDERRSSHDRDADYDAAEQIRPKKGFFQKFSSTAKKLMGTLSDSEAISSPGEGKDELLLEEDEEATEALLKQFDAARRMSREKAKKAKTQRRKSMFHSAEEETTEKHMLTLDMSGSNIDHLQQNESTITEEPFTMRPLRIREDEPDTENVQSTPSAVNTRDFLNLGRKSKRLSKEENDTVQKADTSQPTKSGSFTRPRTLFIPKTDEDTQDSQAIEKTPESEPGQETSTNQAIERAANTAPESHTNVEADQGTSSQADQDTEAPAIQDTPDKTQISPPADHDIPLTEIYRPDTSDLAVPVQDAMDTKITQDIPLTEIFRPAPSDHEVPVQDTTDTQTTQDIPLTEIYKPTPSDVDVVPARETTNEQLSPGASLTETPKPVPGDLRKTAPDTTGDDTVQDTSVTKDDKGTESDEKIVPKPTKSISDLKLILSDTVKDTTAIETPKSAPGDVAKAASDTTDAQTAQDTSVVTETPKIVQRDAAEDTLDTTDAQIGQDISDTKDYKDTESYESADEAPKNSVDTDTGENTERKPSKSGSGLQLAQFLSDASISAAKASQNIREAPVDDGLHKPSFSRTPIPFIPTDNKPVTESHIQSTIGTKSDQDTKTSTSAPKTKSSSSSAEVDANIQTQDVAPQSSASDEDDKTTNTKEEGTSTSASKLNRRFVRVRYEEGKTNDMVDDTMDQEDDEESPTPERHSNALTLDSDEPMNREEEVAEEEASEVSVGGTRKKKNSKPYYRHDS